jgi:serine/threonine-protein kinase
VNDDDATLPDGDDTKARRRAAAAVAAAADKRYRLGEVIGSGGMGEVWIAKDTRIQRDVAVKLLRTTADQHAEARFFREARVQATLDHPAVVPVHDLGVGLEGRPYFVMKRLAGTTLHDALAARDAAFSQRVLLARLIDICFAIEFAHERGVVHRDVKPGNIMLGNYGEAYLLDWGVARIVDDTSALAAVGTLPGGEAPTLAGALLGTPGYMAPEQARGEEVDASADVFALGCVLYEILAGAPALPRGLAAIEATLAAAEHRPSARASDVAPELDDLCARATAADRDRRPSARQLATAIQAYLDGDRDVARRCELAAVHVARARAALARADDDGRATAMREAGRAFVLDPTNNAAKDLIAGLTLGEPRAIPAAALAEANRERADTRRAIFAGSAAIYLGVAVTLALLLVVPIRRAWPLAFTGVGCLAAAAVAWLASRRTLPAMSPWYLGVVALNTTVLIGGAYIFGPLLVTPVYIVSSLAVCLSVPVKFPAAPIVGLHALAFAIPIATELLGITARTFAIEPDRLVLRPNAIELSPGWFAVVLVVSTAVQFANSSVIAVLQRRVQERAHDKVHNLTWHLRQLLPP